MMTSRSDQPDLFGHKPPSGKQLRDRGIASVLEHQRELWRNRYRVMADRFLETVPIHGEFMGEDVRGYAVKWGIGLPGHPNAWSAMFRSWVVGKLRQESVAALGVDRARVPSSHARLSMKYVRMK